MDVLLVLGAWLCCLLLTIFVLLFGQNAAFAHTPLPRLHWLITQGLCHVVRCEQAGARLCIVVQAVVQVACTAAHPIA